MLSLYVVSKIPQNTPLFVVCAVHSLLQNLRRQEESVRCDNLYCLRSPRNYTNDRYLTRTLKRRCQKAYFRSCRKFGAMTCVIASFVAILNSK